MEKASIQPPQRMVFCDFDGTITDQQTAVAMMNQFAPEVSAKLLPEIFAQRISLKQGIREIWESIASCRYEEMIEVSRKNSTWFCGVIRFFRRAE